MELIESLKALADESRLRLVHVLNHGQFNVQELTSILGSSQSTISHHLKVLQSCGIAKSEREGTWMYYSLDDDETTTPSTKLSTTVLEITSNGGLDEALKSQLTHDSREIKKILDKRRDKTRNFFDTHATQWNEMRVTGVKDDELLMQKVTERINPSSALLELGCGSGALFEKLFPRKGESIGVDNSQGMLDEARERLIKYKAELDLRLGNLEHLPLGDHSVDQVVAYMVMHHVAKPQEALAEAYRVLKPGGELVIGELTRHANEHMRERFSDLWLGFEPKSFQGWVKDAGFSDIKCSVLGESEEVFILTARRAA